MSFEFKPSAEIRAFDARTLEGLEVEICCEHTDKDNKKEMVSPSDQYVRVDRIEKYKFLYLSDWAGRVLGEKNTKIKRIIRKAELIQAANGGRSDHRGYSSYWDYFNADRRARILAKRGMDLMSRVMFAGGGDDERADIRLVFDDFELTGSCWEFEAPEEWFSEALKDHPKFRFVDGFYPNADAAIKAFQQKQHEDMFGERYFPAIVFPHNVSQEKLREILWRPKTVSDPIVTDKWIVYGTRCKPHEYAEVIEATYAAGGQVPIGVEWDW